MLRVLEHILMTWPALQPEHRLFNDAIRDLQTESMVELQRLASKMPDPLLVSHLASRRGSPKLIPWDRMCTIN
jgi:exportin-5